MSLSRRVLASLAIALVCGPLSYATARQRGRLASDFQFPLTAARALLAGHNPYEIMAQQHGSYPFDSGLFCPLPAALVTIPFCWLDPYVAGALFFGLSSGLLAFGLCAGLGTSAVSWLCRRSLAVILPSMSLLAPGRSRASICQPWPLCYGGGSPPPAE